jgi:hypothetical protein
MNLNREMRRMLAKQMKPMKNPIEEAKRVAQASQITKDIVTGAFGIVKNMMPKPGTTKKSRKFFGAVKGWFLHKLK